MGGAGATPVTLTATVSGSAFGFEQTFAVTIADSGEATAVDYTAPSRVSITIPADSMTGTAMFTLIVEDSSPITFNRSYRLDRITTHRHAGGLLSGTALQQSFDLSEKCRHVERTISISDRAA